MKNIGLLLLLLLSLGMTLGAPMAMAAVDFNGTLSSGEQQQFDQILSPAMKIYNFIKYAATVLGVIMFVFAGVSFLTSGGDTGKKERAKMMAAGVIIGLIVIWVAPLVVKYIFG